MEMKRKRFLSFVLSLIMVICLMPVGSARAETTRIVYFTNNSNWSGTIYAYAWYGSGTTVLGGWPGTAMTFVEINQYGQSIYSIEVPTSATKIIFNNGSSQTADMSISTTKNGYYNGGTYDYTPTVYYVAGDAGLCGESWNTSADPMTNNNGIREITFKNIAKGSYGFKIVTDSDWSPQWPNSDYKFAVACATADVTIQFNPATQKISVTQVAAHPDHDTDGKCIYCGEAVQHSWSNGVCSVCGLTCTHPNHSTAGICAICASSVAHNYVDGTCSVCKLTCSHAWSSGTCTVCGNTCSHTWSNGTCSVCGVVCQHTNHNTNGICTVCASIVDHSYQDGSCIVCGGRDPYYGAVAQIGSTKFLTLDEAVAEAKTNDMIELLANVQTESLVLMDKIDLDLSGFTLSVTSHVAAYPGSTIIDSTGKSVLKVSKDKLRLQADNGYLPIWSNDAGGYVLRTCKNLHNIERTTDTGRRYQFLPAIGTDSYALLNEGVETSGVTMKVVVSWVKSDSITNSVTFTYSDDLIQDFYKSYDKVNGVFKRAFCLDLFGVEGMELSYAVYFESETGVLLECVPPTVE